MFEWVNIQGYKTQDVILWPQWILFQKGEIPVTNLVYGIAFEIECDSVLLQMQRIFSKAEFCKGGAVKVPCSLDKNGFCKYSHSIDSSISSWAYQLFIVSLLSACLPYYFWILFLSPFSYSKSFFPFFWNLSSCNCHVECI